MTVDTEFDPTRYGMAAEYDDQGNYIYPEGFDVETGDWQEGFEAQREAWEKEYAEAHARYEQHIAQISKAAEADAEAGEAGPRGHQLLLAGRRRRRRRPVARWPATSSSPRCARSCRAASDPRGVHTARTAPVTTTVTGAVPCAGDGAVRSVTVGPRSVTESACRLRRSRRLAYF